MASSAPCARAVSRCSSSSAWKSAMSAASSGSSSPSSASCSRIMAVDLGLDRVGAGHRRLLADQRGRRAEREAGDVPERLERGRADPPLGHQLVETVEMALFLRRPCGRSDARRASFVRAPPAGRHRCGSRHIRRPGRRAASTRGRAACRRGASCRSCPPPSVPAIAISAAPPSERIAFQPAIEMPSNDHCTWSQRTSGTFMMSSRLVAPVAVHSVMPSNIPSSTPGMIDADRAGNGDRQRGQQRQQRAFAAHSIGEQMAPSAQQDRGAVRPALPVAHLARVEPADILRAERAAEQASRNQQGEQPRACSRRSRAASASGGAQHQRERRLGAAAATRRRRRAASASAAHSRADSP